MNGNSIVDVPGDVLQENHYYPFGLNMNYAWLNNAATDNRYQYNGKEWNDDFGLNWNDYGARCTAFDAVRVVLGVARGGGHHEFGQFFAS